MGPIPSQAFGVRAGGGVAMLVGNFDKLTAKYDAVNKATDTFAQQWKATTESAGYQFAQLRNQLETFGVRVGSAVLPALGQLARAAGSFFGALRDSPVV